MEKISSSLFILALLIYYIPKIFKIKKFNFIKAHIIVGCLSILAMCLALVQKIGQSDFIKYIGFTLIMLTIGGTGYFLMRKRGAIKRLHIASTIVFFIYLFVVVNILK